MTEDECIKILDGISMEEFEELQALDRYELNNREMCIGYIYTYYSGFDVNFGEVIQKLIDDGVGDFVNPEYVNDQRVQMNPKNHLVFRYNSKGTELVKFIHRMKQSMQIL